MAGRRNDEVRHSESRLRRTRMTKRESRAGTSHSRFHSSFGFLVSFVIRISSFWFARPGFIRHSGFDIRHSLVIGISTLVIPARQPVLLQPRFAERPAVLCPQRDQRTARAPTGARPPVPGSLTTRRKCSVISSQASVTSGELSPALSDRQLNTDQ